MSDDPRLSVVVPTLGRATLGDQFEALAACRWTEPWEVLAVDNDGSGAVQEQCDRWRDRLPSLRCIDASDRRGRSHAVNVGAAEAAGQWLLLCDDDDLVVPEIVAAVGDRFLAGAKAVVFNFNVREVNPPHVWQGNAQALGTEQGRPMFRSIPAFWGCGAVDRGLFLELGGFDEDRAYAEDLAFSVALHRAGVEPTWIDEQLIHYRLRTTARARFRQRVDTVLAIEAIASENPDIATPATGSPWKRALGALPGLAAGLPAAAVRPAGRMALADKAGTAWGTVTALRAAS